MIPASQPKPTPSRHRFEKPIHNVKKPRASPAYRSEERISLLHHLDPAG